MFSGEVCDTGGTDICVLTTATRIDCDLGANGETMDTLAHFVKVSATEFLGYGTDGDGNEFCCPLTTETNCQEELHVQGTTYVDEIRLNDLTQGWDMECSNSYVHGDADTDVIYGSRALDNFDHLYGDGGGDYIRGLENDDVLNGGADDDTCYGDEGDDYITLGDGNDRAKGGTGDDEIWGENNNDQLCGDIGIDDLHGGNGDDNVFGGTGNDVANDGDGGSGDDCENGDPSHSGCDGTSLTACSW